MFLPSNLPWEYGIEALWLIGHAMLNAMDQTLIPCMSGQFFGRSILNQLVFNFVRMENSIIMGICIDSRY